MKIPMGSALNTAKSEQREENILLETSGKRLGSTNIIRAAKLRSNYNGIILFANVQLNAQSIKRATALFFGVNLFYGL